MKKIFLFILFCTIVVVSGCTTPVTKYTVTFNPNNGNANFTEEVEDGKFVQQPTNPTKSGFVFEYWYSTDNSVSFAFASTPITENITLTAKYKEAETVVPPVDTDSDNVKKIKADIADAKANIMAGSNKLNLSSRGRVNNSTITWVSQSKYISNTGIMLPVHEDNADVDKFGEIRGVFRLGDDKIEETFSIPLNKVQPVVIENSRSVPFKNITTEYSVADGNLDLYFEKDGSVPYVDVPSFLNLLEGFIDPLYDIQISSNATSITMEYQYYDEEEDYTYDLECIIDSVDNTITTNDPGFYWAYVYSTETNYGRHIEYDRTNAKNYYIEGGDVVYDLDVYCMDIVTYNNKVLIPYYIANQLFAGSSYYNVYYNFDGLFGIYAVPSTSSAEYRTISKSSMNGKRLPTDLVIHTFNTLAFNMNYFYGLKDVMGVEEYYDYLFEYKDRLLVDNAEELDNGIAAFLLKKIDEPHTSYGYSSYYNRTSWAGPSTNSLSNYGSRFISWYTDGMQGVDAVIEAKWGRAGITANQWAAYSTSRPNYWFLDNKTAAIILDGFETSDIEESATFDNTIVSDFMRMSDASSLVPAISSGSKFFYYNNNSASYVNLDILVKGVTAAYIDSYKTSLTSLGYSPILWENGFGGVCDMTVGEIKYVVTATYDSDYKLFRLSITNSSIATVLGLEELIESDSAVYMEIMMDLILAEKPGIENIILDLSWNTGGNVGALYRVLGFITDKPFQVSSIDGDTGGASTSSVYIDGVPCYKNLKWALLTSPLSFSAANSMITIFKENNLGKVIGQKSGGGACSITPMLLPNGTAFLMSSNNINAYRTGSGTSSDPYVYHANEFGINPDYLINISLLYDISTLLGIIYS